jgi:hypothetical protein
MHNSLPNWNIQNSTGSKHIKDDKVYLDVTKDLYTGILSTYTTFIQELKNKFIE